jgi:hypothetical protein
MKLWLSRESLTRNFLVAGASGTMKTSQILSWADQAIAAGNPCVFTDIKARADKPSYTSHYYRTDKGFIFNVADGRCVNWRLDREFQDPLTALGIARRLIPLRENSVPYFVELARYILHHAFTDLGLTVPDLIHAINYPTKASTGLYARLEHGKYGDMVASASELRTALLGNLKYALDSLGLLPVDGPDFSAYDWASNPQMRKRHIFLASSRNNWEAQKDLHALMLDLLFVNVQTFPGPGVMFLDEVGIFKSEELEPALSVQRDSGVSIILAFQNFSQIEKHYGQAMKWSILSNPETLLILRMRGRDATDAQDLISAGSDVERIRESRSAHWWTKHRHDYSNERTTIKPVPAGVIQHWKPGCGVLVRPGAITPVQLKHRAAQMNQPGFVPRVWPTYIAPTPEPKKESAAKQYPRIYTQRKLKLESPANIP